MRSTHGWYASYWNANLLSSYIPVSANNIKVDVGIGIGIDANAMFEQGLSDSQCPNHALFANHSFWTDNLIPDVCLTFVQNLTL